MTLVLDEYADRTRPIGVCGLGYVGLHLSMAMARSYRVVAYDAEPLRTDDLRRGLDFFGEVAPAALADSGIRFTSDMSELAACGVIILAVPIEPGPDRKPDFSAVRTACDAVGRVMRPGTVVVFESPLPSIAIEAECIPVLEAASGGLWGGGFRTGYSLGGINPAEKVYKVAGVLRRVSGDGPAVSLFLRALYAPCEDTLIVPPSAMLGVVDARAAKPELPWREIIIGVLAGLNLVMTSWSYGGQALWAQWISFGLSAAAFLALFIPDTPASAGTRLRSAAAELLRCLPFWCGLMLMVLFAMQGFNPRASVEFDGALWQLIPLEFVSGLPTGIEAPFDLKGAPGGMNAFRTLLIFASPWLLFTALWCGLKSRRVVSALMGAVLASGAALAVFAMGMRAAGDTMLYGRVPVSIASPLGPFMYQNQGGAFFYLTFFVGCAYGLRAWVRSTRRVHAAGPHWVALAACLLLLAAALVSHSFGALLVLCLSFFVLVPAILLTRAKVKESDHLTLRRVAPGAIAAAALLSLFFVTVVTQGDFAGMIDKVRAKMDLARMASVDDRRALREATLAMIGDGHPVFGTGAGSYRWYAPQYFSRFPEFCNAQGNLITTASYAHCDWLQFLAEWGVFGLALLGAAIGWFVLRVRALLVSIVPAWPIVAGLFLCCTHAAMDYLLFNPAILLLMATAAFYALFLTRKTPHGPVA